MIKQLLKQLDWSEKEISVYLTLLRLGPSSVRKIATESDVNRGTTYDVLKALQQRGIVTFYEKTAKQFFVAEDPAHILRDLKQQELKIQENQKQLEQALPEMRAISNTGTNKPVSTLYEGLEGVKYILDDVLTKTAESQEKTYYAYSAISPRSAIYSAAPHFTKERIKQNIKTKVIGLSKDGETHGLDERKNLSSPKNENNTYTFIYNGNIAYITQNQQGEPVGMIINNEGIYQTQKLIFEELWNKL